MEHAYASGQAAPTPWRTAAIVAAAVAAIELFILVVVGVAFGAKLISDRAQETVTRPAAAKSAAPSAVAKTTSSGKPVPVAKLTRSQTSVIVLNGNGTPGAAGIAAHRVRRFHYLIAATGNAPRSDFGRSIVMYRAGLKGEAIRLAHDLHVRRVVPLDGLTRRDLQGAHLALIVGG